MPRRGHVWRTLGTLSVSLERSGLTTTVNFLLQSISNGTEYKITQSYSTLSNHSLSWKFDLKRVTRDLISCRDTSVDAEPPVDRIIGPLHSDIHGLAPSCYVPAPITHTHTQTILEDFPFFLCMPLGRGIRILFVIVGSFFSLAPYISFVCPNESVSPFFFCWATTPNVSGTRGGKYTASNPKGEAGGFVARAIIYITRPNQVFLTRG